MVEEAMEDGVDDRWMEYLMGGPNGWNTYSTNG